MPFGVHYRSRRSKPTRRGKGQETQKAVSYLRGRTKIGALVARGIQLNAKIIRMHPAAAAVRKSLTGNLD